MPFRIIRNDITRMSVDAIVNTADPEPVIGLGTDMAVHMAAGERLLEERIKIGYIAPGDAVPTPAFNLPSKYVIHTVSPVWNGGRDGEMEMLRRAYDRTLEVALELDCSSIAFPLMAAGNLGFPREISMKTAVDAFTEFLLEHEMEITLVVFDRDSHRLSSSLFSSVKSFIDENYIADRIPDEYFSWDIWEENDNLSKDRWWLEAERRRRDQKSDILFQMDDLKEEEEEEDEEPYILHQRPIVFDQPKSRGGLSRILGKKKKLEEALKEEPLSIPDDELDEGFSDYLRRLINESGEKPSAIYTRANIDKKLFSKIMSNPEYNPSKTTAIAFGLALKLDLDGMNDLIGRAGFTLTRSRKFDIVIEYAIEHKIYNVIELNMILFDLDQPLIGSGVSKSHK